MRLSAASKWLCQGLIWQTDEQCGPRSEPARLEAAILFATDILYGLVDDI